MQPIEFYKYLEAQQEKEKIKDRKQSYFLACILNTQLTKPIQAEDIYNTLHPEDRELPSAEGKKEIERIFKMKGADEVNND